MPDIPNNPEEAHLAEPAQELAPTAPEPATTDAPETLQEQLPMLDVHPPHHSVTTWREFFVHMTTIVLGLLIAIGLEQSVEALHHLHQRHELEHDLHVETQNNLNQYNLDYQYEDAKEAELVAKRSYVEKLRTNPSPSAHSADIFPLATKLIYWRPLVATWQTAETSGSAALLPREEAAMFYDLNRENEIAYSRFDEFRIIDGARRKFEERFADPASPNSPPTNRMNPDELKQYSGLISDSLDALQQARRIQNYCFWNSQAVEAGARSPEEAKHNVAQHAGAANAPTAAPQPAN